LLARIDFSVYTRYVAPVIEELRGLVSSRSCARIASLSSTPRFRLRRRHTASPGSENLDYWRRAQPLGTGSCALRHRDHARRRDRDLRMLGSRSSAALCYLPGFALGVLLHSRFNHFFSRARFHLGIVIVLPLLLSASTHSEAASATGSARLRADARCSAHQLGRVIAVVAHPTLKDVPGLCRRLLAYLR